jgi:RNA-splicing ligase RtcB
MRLLESELESSDLDQDTWDEVARRIQKNKGNLGDLGGGNHFLDALLPYDERKLYFLIHTGSRQESGLVDGHVDNPMATINGCHVEHQAVTERQKAVF